MRKMLLLAVTAVVALTAIGSAMGHVGGEAGNGSGRKVEPDRIRRRARVRGIADDLCLDPHPRGCHLRQAASEARLAALDPEGKAPAAGEGLRRQHRDPRRPRGHLERRPVAGRLLRHVRDQPRHAEQAREDALLSDRPALRQGCAPLDRDPNEGSARARGACSRRPAREGEWVDRPSAQNRGLGELPSPRLSYANGLVEPWSVPGSNR